jgi:hypothetical protein
MSIIATRPAGETGWAVPATANNSYGPSELRSAYKLTSASAKDGGGRTVAIVDAYKDPNAAKDLAFYRKHFHLSACTTGNKCLKIVNQNGKTSPLPAANANWALEESLDLDMVSAICPKCHILLVEADTNSTSDLGSADDTAVRLGARYVSNSWSGGEFFGEDTLDSDFDHPGDVIDFAAGDFGYGAAYPTDLQYVTAIGGTSLKHAHNGRGWTESVWGAANSATSGGTAGGCSTLEPKASWQREDATEPDGCLNRTENDVSAVGDPNTGVLMYDTYRNTGLFEIGGTSVATPIITSIYALAGTPTKSTYPAQYPYLHSSHLFDVTSGLNGPCESFRKYLCHGEKGYDGPTGLGTPNGTAAFTNGGAHQVTVVDPGTQDYAVQDKVSFTITGLNTKSGASLKWSASGLPSGLSIKAVSRSTNGIVTGKLSLTTGTFHVTVTAKDGSVSGTTHFNIVVVPLLESSVADGNIVLTGPDLCLDSGSDSSGTAVKVQGCDEGDPQLWTYFATGQPNDAGTLRSLGGLCATVANTSGPQKITLSTCTSGLNQQFEYLGFGALWSPFTGGCLNANASAGSQATTANCNFGNDQQWGLPLGPLVAGAGGLCLSNASGTKVEVSTCTGSNAEQWALQSNGQITNESGDCLTAVGNFTQVAVIASGCSEGTNFYQEWETGSSGDLINQGYGLCLADQGNGASGSTAVSNDCYGDAGEVWGIA